MTGSELCLYCGLCCQGVVHRWAVLGDDEVALASALGLSVHTKKDGSLVFHLPCHLYLDGKCSVYDNRPRVCGRYQCKLLKQYLADEISAEESLQLVQQVKALLSQVQQGSEDDDVVAWLHSSDSFKEGDSSSLEFCRTHAEYFMGITTLSVLIKRHFNPRDKRK